MSLQDRAVDGATSAMTALVAYAGTKELFSIPLQFPRASGGVSEHPPAQARASAGGIADRFVVRGDGVEAPVSVTLSRSRILAGDIITLEAMRVDIS